MLNGKFSSEHLSGRRHLIGKKKKAIAATFSAGVKRKWSLEVDLLELKKKMSYTAPKVKARARSTQDIPSELYDFLSN